MNRCAYCLLPHSGRGRCCSAWCAQRVNRQTAGVARARRVSSSRVIDGERKAIAHKRRWRDVAMGRDTEANLAAIFGARITL